MRKINYKAAPKSLEKLASPDFQNTGRSSLGMENFVGEYYFLDINKLVPFKNQARKYFNENEINELASTIREHGIQNPLTVLKIQDGKFEVISGERRLRAAKLIGLEKVPCIIIDNIEKAEEIALIENIQRTDLHPVEFGDSLSSLLAKAGWGDISKLAQKLGKTQPTISDHLAYSKLPDTIKKYLIQNNIKTREILRKLLKCHSIEDMEALLGIRSTSEKIASKSVLRINVKSNNFIVQDKAILSLSKLQRDHLKECLKKVISRIEDLDFK
ncbi:MAG: ParB/RepB/Spo0J family partition protein [Candidatus Paracaedibacteraceae bacterium]|nr:ParB/RepB/Spo0J family partition protein [Candidatus Paracaedibacteraceae bacterium]